MTGGLCEDTDAANLMHSSTINMTAREREGGRIFPLFIDPNLTFQPSLWQRISTPSARLDAGTHYTFAGKTSQPPPAARRWYSRAATMMLHSSSLQAPAHYA